MTTLAMPRRRVAMPRRSAVGVLVAVVTTVAVNVLLLLLIRALDRQEPPSPPPPAVVRRFETVRAAPNAPSVPPVATPAASVPLPLPPLAVALPRIDAPMRLPISLPEVRAPTPAAPATMPSALVAPVAAASTADAGSVANGPRLIGTLDLARFYPRRARDRGITGSTVVQLQIDARGAVTEVTIIASTPAGVFDRAARDLAGTLRFSPATTDGRAEPALIRQTIRWEIAP